MFILPQVVQVQTTTPQIVPILILRLQMVMYHHRIIVHTLVQAILILHLVHTPLQVVLTAPHPTIPQVTIHLLTTRHHIIRQAMGRLPIIPLLLITHQAMVPQVPMLHQVVLEESLLKEASLIYC